MSSVGVWHALQGRPDWCPEIPSRGCRRQGKAFAAGEPKTAPSDGSSACGWDCSGPACRFQPHPALGINSTALLDGLIEGQTATQTLKKQHGNRRSRPCDHSMGRKAHLTSPAIGLLVGSELMLAVVGAPQECHITRLLTAKSTSPARGRCLTMTQRSDCFGNGGRGGRNHHPEQDWSEKGRSDHHQQDRCFQRGAEDPSLAAQP